MHKKACVVLFRSLEDELYVLRLLTQPERGNGWAHVTGSVEKGESFQEGAARELEEETGHALPVHPTEFSQEFLDQFDRQVKERGFWAILKEDLPITLDPKEHQAYEWVSIREITPESFEHKSHFRAFLLALKEVQA